MQTRVNPLTETLVKGSHGTSQVYPTTCCYKNKLAWYTWCNHTCTTQPCTLTPWPNSELNITRDCFADPRRHRWSNPSRNACRCTTSLLASNHILSFAIASVKPCHTLLADVGSQLIILTDALGSETSWFSDNAHCRVYLLQWEGNTILAIS